jgi:hypothetical protein
VISLLNFTYLDAVINSNALCPKFRAIPGEKNLTTYLYGAAETRAEDLTQLECWPT